MPVDSSYAQTLEADATYVVATPTGAPAWGERAVTTELISALATAAAAQAEAQRQADFWGGPLAIDEAEVTGQRRDLMLKLVTIVHSKLGYSGAGALFFVINYTENANGTTTLNGLRKL